jgi:hypothetical protein
VQKLQADLDVEKIFKTIEKRLLKDEADMHFEEFNSQMSNFDKNVQRIASVVEHIEVIE